MKLKEISYIHAEGYAAGELKHGPLALVDNDMPVVILAPQDDMLDKLKSNMEEVQARGGELFVFADENSGINAIKSASMWFMYQQSARCLRQLCIAFLCSCCLIMWQFYVVPMSINLETWPKL